MKKYCAVMASAVALYAGLTTVQAHADQTWSASSGHATLLIDQASLDSIGMQILLGNDEHQYAALVSDLDAKTDLTTLLVLWGSWN